MVLKPSDKWGYFPLTKEFLQAPIDDIFYGYLFYQAAWDNKGKYYYLDAADMDTFFVLYGQFMNLEPEEVCAEFLEIVDTGFIELDEEKDQYIMFSDPHAAISWGFIDGAIIDEIVQTKEKGMLKLYLFLYKMDKVKTLRQFSGINFSLQKIENEIEGKNCCPNLNRKKGYRRMLCWLAREGLIRFRAASWEIPGKTTVKVPQLLELATNHLQKLTPDPLEYAFILENKK